ncbi:MAG: hypothetical protein OEV06_10480, partial [Anaerolineae bacterium]|nr:hypothetical protein [Anaerolineae bacterium]
TVPPEALDWAQESGFPLPPETYDVLFIPAAPDADVNINAPIMFSYVGGVIEIHGSATGDDFEFYRLQVGSGLNPDQWLQIGSEEQEPVEDGLLGRWDTGESSGLFALQLLVVFADQSVKTATIQVTVDNHPPEAAILFPEHEQIFAYPSERDLVFQIQVSDNLALDRLEIFIDGELLTTLSKAPYAAPWLGDPGAHTLRVVAYDLAGNSTESEITFLLQR